MNYKFYQKLGLIATTSLIVASSTVYAEEVEKIDINLNSSQYMRMNWNIIRIAVGSPDIATVLQLPSSRNEFLIVSHKPGSTTLFVWTADKKMYQYLINVSPEDVGQSYLIEKAIGLPGVHVKVVDNRVLLTGTVKNQYERNFAVQTARLYVGKGSESSLSVGSGVDMKITTRNSDIDSGSNKEIGGTEIKSEGQVIDLLRMLHPTQVRFEAQVIAIRPQDRKNIGILYGTDPLTSPGVFSVGESQNNNEGRDFKNNPWRWATARHSDINLSIQALVTQNRAKILSRPSITTMSGEEAIIQVGGEIPYTVRSSDNPTVEFKDYGIILQLKPVVDSQNRITSAVHAEVSNMSGESVDGQPILDRRRADSVITINSGSTMVIGGLMDSSETKAISKIPLLGDIPILGEFFKYSSKSKDKQELLILVTPYLVDDEETSQAKMSDSMKDFYNKGRQEKSNMDNVNLNDPLPPATSTKDRKKKSKDKINNQDNSNSDNIPGEEVEKPFAKK
ncbi:MAG: pilus assembly protein N-terminal domain-containing protein [Selenomonadaceae bacterium]|nr:pilus assembly protein N-terminal domain-containing protein [Selenomonadaceae bacterium]